LRRHFHGIGSYKEVVFDDEHGTLISSHPATRRRR